MESPKSIFVCWFAAVLLAGCGKAPPPPPPDITLKLLQHFECRRLDKNEPLPSEIILPRGTGIYLELKFEPIDPLPAEVDGKLVHRIGKWPMGILIFPKGEPRLSGKTTMNFFSPYSSAGSFASPDQGDVDFPPLGGTGRSWFEHGYKGEPKTDDTTNSVRWTYLCQPKDDISEFQYELLMWPCFDDSKASEIKLGSPIVLQEGILKLVDQPVQ